MWLNCSIARATGTRPLLFFKWNTAPPWFQLREFELGTDAIVADAAAGVEYWINRTESAFLDQGSLGNWGVPGRIEWRENGGS